jgi:hypothetical protein
VTLIWSLHQIPGGLIPNAQGKPTRAKSEENANVSLSEQI